MATSAFPPRVLDAGAVLISLFGVYLSLGTPDGPHRPGEAPAWWWLDLAVGVLGSLLVLVRGRHPVALAIGLSLVGIVFTTVWLAGAVATFALAVHRPWPVAVVISVLGLAIAPVTEIVRGPTDPPGSWADLAWALAVTAAILASGIAVRARHELMDSLVERAERAETEAALRAEAARSAERTRIAREMHDVLAHRLSMVSLHAGALAHRRTASPEEVREALEVVRAGAREALDDLRVILGVLRDPDDSSGEQEEPPQLRAPQPTLGDLDHLLDGVRAAGTAVTLHDRRAPGPLPDERGRTLYRIAQEALTNAARHAPGRPVEVVLNGAPGEHVELEVTNPLPAAVVGGPPGNGLLGIAERVALAGGTVLARGPEGDRWRVAVRVPWPDAERGGAGPVEPDAERTGTGTVVQGGRS